MNNNVRRQQITEAELRAVVRNMIIEEIENGQLDEGFMDTLRSGWGALKGTFGGDANRMQQGAANAGRAAGGLANRAIQAGKDAAGRVGKAVSGAAQNVGQYAQDRANAFKGQYNASQNINKINNLLSNIDELQQSGVLSGPQMEQAIAVIKKQLQGAIGRNKGAITGWKNSVS